MKRIRKPLTEEQKIKKLAYEREYRKRNPDRVKKWKKNYIISPKTKEKRRINEKQRLSRIKFDVMSHYSNGFPLCKCCKEKDIRFLTIDHINGGGNKHRKEAKLNSGSDTYRWLRKNNYPSGFQVLCFNCNMAKGKYGQCPHLNSL